MPIGMPALLYRSPLNTPHRSSLVMVFWVSRFCAMMANHGHDLGVT
jgi:hypothetical protein